MGSVAAVLVAVLVLQPGASTAQQTSAPEPKQADGASTPSPPIERLRERLQQPELKMPTDVDTPTFRVRIRQDYPVETVLEMIRREIAEDARGSAPRQPLPKAVTASGAQPLAAVDLLAIAGAIKKAFYAANERQARREVEEALAEFCKVRDCSTVESK